MSEDLKNNQGQPNPDADQWMSLKSLDELRNDINQNYLDDEEYINSRKPIDYSAEQNARDLKNRQDLRDQKLAEIDAYEAKLEQMQDRSDKEYSEDFSGETNLNSKTKAKRTFSDKDLYPQIQYRDEEGRWTGQESPQDNGERTKKRNDMIALTELLPKDEEESPSEYSQRISQVHADFPRKENESLEDYKERIKEADANNDLLISTANHQIDSDSPIAQKLIDDMNNIEDMKKGGRFDDARAKELQREVLLQAIDDNKKQLKEKNQQQKDEERQRKLGELRAKKELEEKAKQELEAKAKQESMEKVKQEIEKKIDDVRNAAEDARDEHLRNAEEFLSEMKGLNSEEAKNLAKELADAKSELDRWGGALAESYAKNRRLFVGRKNRAEFMRNKENYSESLSRYLRIQARLSYKEGLNENASKIESERNKLAKEIEDGKITVEDANKLLGDKWAELSQDLQDGISEEFVSGYLKEQNALEKSTIDRLDNGSLFRKVVSKIVDNKALKITLGVAGAAGLAATGFGLATGALALSTSYTAGGIALGAGKGALAGTIMSRQSSKNSAIRGFANTDDIRHQLESIDAVNNGEDVDNVAKWLMQRYEEANTSDRSSNRKRTAIAAGLGAAMGAAMSGVGINKNVQSHQSYQKTIGYEPTEEHAAHISEVNHTKGTGTQQLFRELGGDGDTYFSSGAHDAMSEVVEKYGMVVGQTDYTYPGRLSDWPETAREAFTEVADAWARKGLVPSIKTGGAPIYDTYGHTINKLVASSLYNGFKDAATIAEAGALAGAISRKQNRISSMTPAPEVRPASEPNDFMLTVPFIESPRPAEAESESAEAESESAESAESTETESNPESAEAEPAEAESEPTQQDQSPEQPSPDQDGEFTTSLADAIRASFLDAAGSEGVEFMTDAEGYNEEKGNRMAEWWNGLNDETKNDIIYYERANNNSNLGSALRTWLFEVNPQIGYQTTPIDSRI